MPKAPLIASPRGRAALIGGLMVLLFLGSVALSWALTGAPLRAPDAPPPRRVTLADATLSLPATWRFESGRESAGGLSGDWWFVNTRNPRERLRVLRVTSATPAQITPVLARVLPELVAGRRITSQPQAQPQPTDAPDARKLELIFSTQRLASPSNSTQLHAVTLLTPDGQRFWVFQLTDQVSSTDWRRQGESRPMELGNLEQLRRMLEDVTFEPAT